MKEQEKTSMIKELNEIYPSTRFDFREEEYSLQLLHNDMKLRNDDLFLDKICDIAIKFLNEEEQMIFAILYDYYDEISPLKFDNEFEYRDDFYYTTSSIGHGLSFYSIDKGMKGKFDLEDVAA